MTKIIIFLASGVLLTFPLDERVKSDCFSQGYSIVKKISVYRGPGPDQGWYLNGAHLNVAGWYCE